MKRPSPSAVADAVDVSLRAVLLAILLASVAFAAKRIGWHAWPLAALEFCAYTVGRVKREEKWMTALDTKMREVDSKVTIAVAAALGAEDMSKFLHDDAGPTCGKAAKRLGIQWPALPWRCPTCTKVFPTHAETVATLGVRRYEHPEEATFMCATCDLDLFERPERGH